MNKGLYFLLGVLMVLSACEKQADKDAELIQDYIAENNLVALEGSEGLYYVIEKEGTGLHAAVEDQVTVHYEGFLLDGSKFDSSIDRGQASTFFLTQVIRGWQLGIPLFKEGGKGTLIIPSVLGYGSTARSGIPKNSVLVFNVELIDVL
ncbi:MAG: peptidylprolyl isomerase [Aureispira sp.]|nr:peptidylprolyl isomerase [Aureispira sp.]